MEANDGDWVELYRFLGKAGGEARSQEERPEVRIQKSVVSCRSTIYGNSESSLGANTDVLE
jgi:hypothetical protein